LNFHSSYSNSELFYFSISIYFRSHGSHSHPCTRIAGIKENMIFAWIKLKNMCIPRWIFRVIIINKNFYYIFILLHPLYEHMLQHRETIVKPLKFLVYSQHTSLVSNIVQEFFYFIKKFSFNSHDRIFTKKYDSCNWWSTVEGKY
jgi:hypothetical protein